MNHRYSKASGLSFLVKKLITDRKFNPRSTTTQYALNPLSSSTICAEPHQLLTFGQGPLLFGVRRNLKREPRGNCTLPAIRIGQLTPLAARRQRLIYTNPRSAALATSPNSAARIDTPHSALAAGADTTTGAVLLNE